MKHIQNVSLIMSAGRSDQFPAKNMAEIAFVGRSNVGKSSMLNNLLNRKSMARTSSSPGKTATVNFYEIDRRVMFVDLPGYGFTAVSGSLTAGWGKLMDDYFAAGRISLAVQLLDMRHDPSELDMTMLDWYKQTKQRYLIALTKADKLNKTEFANRLQEFGKMDCCRGALCLIPFSVLSKIGRDILMDQIDLAIDSETHIV